MTGYEGMVSSLRKEAFLVTYFVSWWHSVFISKRGVLLSTVSEPGFFRGTVWHLLPQPITELASCALR
jgi:hypothetical protein